ncbi:MAG: hypothetical protein EBV87_06085 [Alphaproteobacteria bacterium]|nr:hypothetical protein [Alphaproteobacteria bacterium]
MGMAMLKMTAVVAMAQNRVIGDGKGLIWHIPDDLRAEGGRVRAYAWRCASICKSF